MMQSIKRATTLHNLMGFICKSRLMKYNISRLKLRFFTLLLSLFIVIVIVKCECVCVCVSLLLWGWEVAEVVAAGAGNEEADCQ